MVNPSIFNFMDTVSNNLLMQQWQTLHNSHESYESYALIIKLIAITTTLIALSFSLNNYSLLLLLAILWLQEGIWKTFQQRTVSAILEIESKLMLGDIEQHSAPVKPYLFYSQWQDSRQSSLGLVKEYVGNALKPTVIFPYLPLILLVVIF